MRRKEYKGYIAICEYGFLTLDEDKNESYGSSLAGDIEEDWKKGQKVSLRYYIGEEPMTLEQATTALIEKTFGGEVNAKYILDAYSEYTIMEMEENLQIGGHDMIGELYSHEGKYAVIVVEEVFDNVEDEC